ncbi:MAG: hypothetical protein SOW36_00335 [Porphyromonas sp.]|uniref:hypothetical protein n=1 Tax=Porphyromonas sp. TaxID=1924944 RepID=UPI002A76340F|nr:hypothetical protein [Porphyromonas sp.]MDY3111075.1 hypothetical protein [Porphyromonas sp.]
MEANSNDNYVLVLEDRTEVKKQQEAGKLTIVSGIDGKGNLKTTEANYRQVKQEVLSLVDSETARIKADPTLSHLIKE